MLNKKRNVILTDIVSALFILLFVYAATNKVLDFEKFRIELAKSPILNHFSGLVSIVVPITEIVISLMLAIKRFQYLALYASFSLMVIFSTYIIGILEFSPYIPCSCGGILENMTWPQHLIFNVIFIFLGFLAILIYPINTKTLSAVRGKTFVPKSEGI